MKSLVTHIFSVFIVRSVLILLMFSLSSFALAAANAEDPTKELSGSIHQGLECESCHSMEKEQCKKMPPVNCSTCHPEIFEKYSHSIHGKLRAAGVKEAASCHDCHGTHDIRPMGDRASKIHKEKVPSTCGRCHQAVYAEYSESVHGEAVARGLPDSPGCTDCHGEHEILPPTEKLSRVYPTNIAKTTCPQCHANERIITKYNIPGGRVDSYQDTYHGLAGDLGDVHVANCASCHGVHNIFPSSDPRSSIHPENLQKTCGQCHPNANKNFVKGSVHGYLKSKTSGMIIKYVTLTYLILIVVVIGGFLYHNALDYIKKLRVIYQQRRYEPYYPRLNLNERIQHGILLVSFFTLVITGFALKFGWYIPFVGGEVNTYLRGTLHRIAGLFMITVLLYNIVYFLTTRRGRQIVWDMLPRLSDVKNLGHYLRYLHGKEEHRPRFARFTYWEKMEYWAVIWGGVVMGVTGFILWFENWSLTLIPMWGIDVVTLIHYLEAILATLAIFIGHLYFVVLNPDVAPMSFTWIMGRIPKEYALEEHPLEYEGRPAEVEAPRKEPL